MKEMVLFKKYSGVHPRVSTLIQPSFQKVRENRMEQEHCECNNLFFLLPARKKRMRRQFVVRWVCFLMRGSLFPPLFCRYTVTRGLCLSNHICLPPLPTAYGFFLRYFSFTLTSSKRPIHPLSLSSAILTDRVRKGMSFLPPRLPLCITLPACRCFCVCTKRKRAAVPPRGRKLWKRRKKHTLYAHFYQM